MSFLDMQFSGVNNTPQNKSIEGRLQLLKLLVLMWKMQFPPLAGNPAPEGMKTLIPEVIKQNVPHRIDLAFWNH